MQEKFLPIGTVVMLKGGTKRLMVTGFCMYDKNNTQKMYDYCGCLYPEGMISSDQTALFDHEQIEKVYYVGLQDEEEKKCKEQLKELLSNPEELSKATEAIMPKNEEEFDPRKVPPIGPGLPTPEEK